jgi:hypothetical protein
MATEAPTTLTEAEITQSFAAIKRSIRIATFGITPLTILMAWYFEVGTLGWVIVGIISVYEFAGYPFMMRYLDRNEDARLAELREAQGLTPASQLPDVGV